MRAVRIVDGTPTLETLAGPEGDGVCVKVVSSSICGSDLHLLDGGIAEGMILGHEFCGIAPDGTPVAVEPMAGCGSCWACDEGHLSFCSNGAIFYGIGLPGGMADEIIVHPDALVALPSGLALEHACLVEPLRSRPTRTAPGSPTPTGCWSSVQVPSAWPPPQCSATGGSPPRSAPVTPTSRRSGTTGRLPRCRRRLRRRDRRRRHQCLNR